MTFIPDNQRFVIQAVLDEGVKRLRGVDAQQRANSGTASQQNR